MGQVAIVQQLAKQTRPRALERSPQSAPSAPMSHPQKKGRRHHYGAGMNSDSDDDQEDDKMPTSGGGDACK